MHLRVIYYSCYFFCSRGGAASPVAPASRCCLLRCAVVILGDVMLTGGAFPLADADKRLLHPVLPLGFLGENL